MCGKMSTSENDSDFQRLNCSGAVLCKLQYGLRVFSCKMYSPDVGGCSGSGGATPKLCSQMTTQFFF
jgi:hypothetical protein